MTDKKKFIIMLGVLLVLILCYLGINSYNRSKTKKEAEVEKENTIYLTNLMDVTAISYEGVVSQSFQKNEDGTWSVTDDKEFPLNSDVVSAIVDTFSKLTADRQLNDGDELSDYGLDQPQYTVSLTCKDGTETKIYIGNAVKDDYYATVEGKNSVYTISSEKISGLQTPLDEMAVLDQFPTIGSGNIVSEEIVTQAGTTEYKADAKDDSESIAVVVGGLSVLSLDTPVDYHLADNDAAKYGLDDAEKTTVNVVYKEDNKEKELSLLIGKEDDKGNRYLKLQDSQIVYTVSDEICNNILNNNTNK